MRFWARRGTVVLGGLTAASLVVLVVLGLFVSDPDFQQGDAVRLMYLHVPAAWVSYLAYGVTSLASALYLWKRTRAQAWDTLAGASAEIGVLFTGLTLVLGSLWGRPVWPAVRSPSRAAPRLVGRQQPAGPAGPRPEPAHVAGDGDAGQRPSPDDVAGVRHTGTTSASARRSAMAASRARPSMASSMTASR